MITADNGTGQSIRSVADGRFYDMQEDRLEQQPLLLKGAPAELLALHAQFKRVLDESPQDPPKLAKPKVKAKQK